MRPPIDATADGAAPWSTVERAAFGKGRPSSTSYLVALVATVFCRGAVPRTAVAAPPRRLPGEARLASSRAKIRPGGRDLAPTARTQGPVRITQQRGLTSGFTAFAGRVWVRVSGGPYVAESEPRGLGRRDATPRTACRSSCSLIGTTSGGRTWIFVATRRRVTVPPLHPRRRPLPLPPCRRTPLRTIPRWRDQQTATRRQATGHPGSPMTSPDTRPSTEVDPPALESGKSGSETNEGCPGAHFHDGTVDENVYRSWHIVDDRLNPIRGDGHRPPLVTDFNR